MRKRHTAKALISLALVMAMLVSMCIVGFTGVSAADTTLNYEFAYNNAGYAEGRLSLSGASGTYILYWADDTKALEGYTGIAQMTVSSGTKYFEMPANTAIPAGATKVIAVESGADATVDGAAAVFDIPADKQFKGGTKQYTFEALSDIHIQVDDSYWYLSKTHFANALEVAVDREVDFMTICGDMVNGYSYSNLQNEYPQYLKLIAQSNYNNPIYETNGNHEMKGGTASQNLDLYRKYTGLNTTTGAVSSTPYYEQTINGDHYIFLVLEISGSPNTSSEFTQTQLDWFEGLLKKYSGDGHKIIVNQHALIRGYGAGDNKVTPYYGGALQSSYTDVRRLMDIMEAYPEIIMLSGHSHIDFKYGYNFDNENGNTCYTVHIPSTSSTTHPNSGGTTDYTMDVNSSQGYLIDVYDDYVILNGTDLAFNLICPSYTYMVDYTGEELDKNELPEIVYDTVDVTVDISAITTTPTEVICCAVSDDATSSQQIPMTKNSDGTYSAKVIEEYSSVYFVIKSSIGQLNTSAFPVANCKITLGSQKLTYTPTGTVTDNVHAHVWGSGGDGTVWPGVAMTKGADGNYSVIVPASDYSGVVFNEGENADQTSDLNFSDYASDFVADVYVTLDGETTEPATTATTAPTEPTTTEPITTEPTEPVTTEPVVDELAPVVTIEIDKNGNFVFSAYAADLAEDVEYQFALNGNVYQAYSDKSTFTCSLPYDNDYYIEVSAKYADGTEHTTKVEFSVVNGEAVLPDNPEIPTLPTEATEPGTQATTATVDEPVSTIPTTESQPVVEYFYGDADLDGKVNIKDATAIQKFVAKLITFDETQSVQADVNADATVNIKDATMIQKYVAKLVDSFPAEESTELVAVGANYAELAVVGATVAELKAEVKTKLSTEYQYASYDAYMALKKAYMNANVTYDELNNAYTDYKTMKGNNPLANPGGTATIGDIDIGQTGTGTPTIPGPSIGGGSTGGDSSGDSSGGSTTTDTVKVYLKPDSSWENAYIYGFYGEVGGTATGTPLGDYPGTAMTVDADGWYVAEVPADIDYIKFCDGSATNNRTDNIPNSLVEDGVTFTITTKSGTYWGYTTGSTITPPDDNTDNQGSSSTDVNTPSTTASSYVIHGNLSGSWADLVLYVSTEDSNIATATMDVAAGSYEFVMHNTSTDEWIKNGGTIDDTCEGWRFGTDKDGNTTFNATGGTYVFNFDLTTLKLSITKG